LRYTIPLSNLIIEARKAKKLSLRDFCKILQEKNIMIGIVALVYLEENGVVPGISAMLAIADVLEIDKKELLYSALLVKTSDYMLKWAHDYELVKQIKTP
jgi:transcriptional regulator with XRE-family HTH domain